jgi:hypothetical protein
MIPQRGIFLEISRDAHRGAAEESMKRVSDQSLEVQFGDAEKIRIEPGCGDERRTRESVQAVAQETMRLEPNRSHGLLRDQQEFGVIADEPEC